MMTRHILIACALVAALSASSAGQAPDRIKPPASGPAPALKLPAIQKRQLSNGMPVWLVELHEVPVVQVNLLVAGGSADDPARKFGVASLMAAMLAEGAGTRTSLDIADAIDFLGADLSASAAVNSMGVRLHVPVARLADALPIMADVALRPTFPASELERLRQQRLTCLLQARDDAATTAALAFAKRALRCDHRFGTATMGTPKPSRGSPPGSAVVLRLHGSPGKGHAHRRGRRHDGQGVALARIELRNWKAAGPAPSRPPLSRTGQPVTRVVYLVDKPNAPQSQIRIGWSASRATHPTTFRSSVMNTILGGSFSSRLNLNLREKHGYTYGASSSFDMRLRPARSTPAAGVQTDKTSESLTEFFNELNGILKPVPADELTRAKNYVALRFPASFESTGDISRRLEDMILFQLPDDYLLAIRSEHSRQSRQPTSQRVAQNYIVPDKLAVVVVGDKKVDRARDSRVQPRRDQVELTIDNVFGQ